jgi:hypothetical protein
MARAATPALAVLAERRKGCSNISRRARRCLSPARPIRRPLHHLDTGCGCWARHRFGVRNRVLPVVGRKRPWLRECCVRHSERYDLMDSGRLAHLSYSKARLAAGLRRPWTRKAGLEPASLAVDGCVLYHLSYLRAVRESCGRGWITARWPRRTWPRSSDVSRRHARASANDQSYALGHGTAQSEGGACLRCTSARPASRRELERRSWRCWDVHHRQGTGSDSGRG